MDVDVDPGVDAGRPAADTTTFDTWATARVAGLLRFAYLVAALRVELSQEDER